MNLNNMLNGAYNALSHVPDEKIPTILETLFDTAGHAIAPADIREHVATCIEDGRDHYYLALARALGASPSPVVLDGSNATSLAGSIEQYISPNGLTFTGATDIGVHYPKNNEDRVSLRPDQGFAAVIDGIGGESGSDHFANACAHVLGMHATDMNMAFKTLNDTVKSKNIDGDACIAAAWVRRFDQRFTLDAWRIGDVRIEIINPDGVVYRKSKDETYAQNFSDVYAKQIEQEQKKDIPDQTRIDELHVNIREMLYTNSYRNVVFDCIREHLTNPPTPLWTNIELQPGSFVLLLSDGITDNVLLEEILERMRQRNIPLSAETLLAMIDELTTARMRDHIRIQNTERKTGEPFCDGFAQKPKPDNRAFVCIEIPHEPVHAPTVNNENAAY